MRQVGDIHQSSVRQIKHVIETITEIPADMQQLYSASGAEMIDHLRAFEDYGSDGVDVPLTLKLRILDARGRPVSPEETLRSAKCWVPSAYGSEFPIQNLPYGVFRQKDEAETEARCGVAIGDLVLDLTAVGALLPAAVRSGVFDQPSLNRLMGLGKAVWSEVRSAIQLLLLEGSELHRDPQLQHTALLLQSEVAMLLPASIGDYTVPECPSCSTSVTAARLLTWCRRTSTLLASTPPT